MLSCTRGNRVMADIVAVIPARLNSTRFPRKVLQPYRRKPLLFYVWRDVGKAKTIDRVVIATDSREIEREATAFGAEVVRTKARHATGSDRAAEAVRKIGGRIIVNVQADNFGLSGAMLDRVVQQMRTDRKISYATLAYRLTADEELFNPHIVKVVRSKATGDALWFSRFPIPYVRGALEADRVGQHRFYGHIGIYFYRAAALNDFAGWKRGEAEQAESLEQLRILENGGRIRLFETKRKTVSVDTPEDLTKLDSVY